jgi:hypothetical protein
MRASISQLAPAILQNERDKVILEGGIAFGRPDLCEPEQELEPLVFEFEALQKSLWCEGFTLGHETSLLLLIVEVCAPHRFGWAHVKHSPLRPTYSPTISPAVVRRCVMI